MRVAIIGAGLSGLSCAHELQRLGVVPDIFEKRGYLGDSLGYTKVTLRLFDRPHHNAIRYIKRKCKIDIRPINPLKEIVMTGPSKKNVIRGKLGFVFKKGQDEFSLENQIASQLNMPIKFDSYIRLEDIRDKYDCIVAATGEDSIAKQLGTWTPTFNTFVRIAIVAGNFKTDTLNFWADTEYSKNGYCYLIPNNPKEACFTLVADNIPHSELNHYFKKFLEMKRDEFPYPILETRDYEFNAGIAHPCRIGNVYLTGNSAGYVSEFLGIGLINAIESGVLAARSIALNLDYNKLVKPIQYEKEKLIQFRKAVNTFNNRDFDRIITILGMPGIKQLIYNIPFVRATHGTFLAKLYNSFHEK